MVENQGQPLAKSKTCLTPMRYVRLRHRDRSARDFMSLMTFSAVSAPLRESGSLSFLFDAFSC